MYLHEVDLRKKESHVQAARGIAALAVDPGSVLDVCRLGGKSLLRPGGLWQPPGGPLPPVVPVTAVRNTGNLDLPECSIITLQVFEPGDVIPSSPPKRFSGLHEVSALALTGGGATPTFVMKFPFTGRRALALGVRGPAGTVSVRVVGRRLDSGNNDIIQVISGSPPPGADVFTSVAASAELVGSGVAGKVTGHQRYYGGTDSLEMWDEMHVMANATTGGTYYFVAETTDEVNG